MTPQVYIKHPAVSRYIVGGADLMLPGVLLPPGGLPPFQKDGLVAVCSPGGGLGAGQGRAMCRKGCSQRSPFPFLRAHPVAVRRGSLFLGLPAPVDRWPLSPSSPL